MLNVLYDNNIVLSLKRYPILNSTQLRNFVQQLLHDQLPAEVSHVQRSGIFLRKEEKDCLVCLERTVQKRACTQCKNCEFECS